MPKSDTWLCGTGLETLTGMDNASSCDSVVSGHSAISDNSLEHLSAEEKACLMFLEETIESLDTEDERELSNEETDLLPIPGSLASRLADLSASINKTKLNGLRKHHSMETIREKVEHKPIQNYLVPTPFVLASSSNQYKSNMKAGIQLKKKSLSFNNCSQKPTDSHVPFEVNGLITPTTKPKDNLVKTGERGPLSYDALVYLRRSASTKKTPLCPTVDHTIDLVKCPSVIMEDPNNRNVGLPDRAVSGAGRFRIGPPPVAPKPKRIPSNISVKMEKEDAPASNSSYNIKNAIDPKVVRQEALQKLGLLKDQQSETQVTQQELSKSHLSVGNGFLKGPVNISQSRSPSFCHAPVPPEPRSKAVQSSSSFHHYLRCPQHVMSLSHSGQRNRLKIAGPEIPHTVLNHKNETTCPEPRLQTVSEDQPVSPKASNSVTYTVMMVPGMGADRKEALRKLGLLRD
nr:specifically androgen-regulated gene protein-like [Nerophis lumbriciformis]